MSCKFKLKDSSYGMLVWDKINFEAKSTTRDKEVQNFHKENSSPSFL